MGAVFSGKCDSRARLDGKTVVITGCNTGIGKETVSDLVQRGADVVMACRNVQLAEEAAQDIRHSLGGMEAVGKITVTVLDLASLKSVRACASHLLQTLPHIDLLINNAGIMLCPKSQTEDGFEMQFGVNHLGHFLFTCLLLPRLRASEPARIVTVSSLAHQSGTINFEDLMFEKSYNARHAYAQSKLANILFTNELAERLKGQGVTVYSLHPGVVATDLARHLDNVYFKGATWMVDHIMKIFIKSPKQGAQTTIYCAVDESLASESGYYYSDCHRTRPSSQARDKDVAKKLWEVSTALTGLGEWDPFTADDTPHLNQNHY